MKQGEKRQSEEEEEEASTTSDLTCGEITALGSREESPLSSCSTILVSTYLETWDVLQGAFHALISGYTTPEKRFSVLCQSGIP